MKIHWLLENGDISFLVHVSFKRKSKFLYNKYQKSTTGTRNPRTTTKGRSNIGERLAHLAIFVKITKYILGWRIFWLIRENF